MTVTGRFDRNERTLELSRHFSTPIDEVWASVVDSDLLSRWFGTWTGDPSTGRVEVTMNAEAEPVPPVSFEIQACDPPRLLSVVTTDDVGQWRLTVEITQDSGTTTLVLIHRDVDAEMLTQTGPGWEWYLDRLAASIEDRRIPTLADFEETYRALAPQYGALLDPASDGQSTN